MGASDNAYEAADAAARLRAWFKAEGPLVMDEADFDDVQTVLADNKRLRARLVEATMLLGHFVDHEDQPCRLNHHGACEERGGSSLRPCDVAVGHELLARIRNGNGGLGCLCPHTYQPDGRLVRDGVLAVGCPVHDTNAEMEAGT